MPPDSASSWAAWREAFATQAEVCRELDAPFTAELCSRCADGVRRAGPMRDVLSDYTGHPLRDAAQLRLLGAVHGLVLRGSVPDLAAHYPTAPGRSVSESTWHAFEDVLRSHAALLRGALSSPPQTNEVGRSAALFGGFQTIFGRAGLPLRLFELGSSAGLLQLWHRFRYELDDTTSIHGDPNSEVVVRTEWRGPPPRNHRVPVRSTVGCDLSPVDVSDPHHRLRLQAFVWPDHLHRRELLSAALSMARRHPPAVEAGEAAEWFDRRVETKEGCATVLFHSIVWAYLPDAQCDRIRAGMESIGATATATAPLFWLRLEDPPSGPGSGIFELRLRSWTGGKDSGKDELLAHTQPHGTWVDWLGPKS